MQKPVPCTSWFTRRIGSLAKVAVVFSMVIISCKQDETPLIGRCYPVKIDYPGSFLSMSVQITYNSSNQVTSITLGYQNGVKTTIGYSYDTKGNISSGIGGSIQIAGSKIFYESTGSSTFKYDANDNLIQEDYMHSSGTLYQYTYQYNQPIK